MITGCPRQGRACQGRCELNSNQRIGIKFHALHAALEGMSILLTAFVVCLFAVPNFFSDSTIKKLPSWAAWVGRSQVVLGLDLQGGSHICLKSTTATWRAQGRNYERAR